jgi:aminopeptidase-like protein
MLLQELASERGSLEAARAGFELMERVFPLCRSITGNGVRRTLDAIAGIVPLDRHEVPSGTPVFDWEVPPEWNIRDAYIARSDGSRVVDFKASSLHVVGYSVPTRCTMSLDELEPHLHSLPDHPDRIPYRTTYWREHWGFCLRHRDRERLGPGPYDVVIDADLAPGHLTYAECVVPGSTDGLGIVYTHTCHPSLANDNLTGLAAVALLGRELRQQRPRLTWRLVFGPGTIGSLTWLARNEDCLSQVRCGLVTGLLGDPGPLTYKRSRRGNCATDRAAALVLERHPGVSRIVDFEPYGYDERQFCSPGFDLPFGRLTRSPNGAYAEYHSSADDLSLVKVDKLAESIRVLAQLIDALDKNRDLVNLSPKGEPRLGKRGLYGTLGGTAPGEGEQAMLWLLSLGDGAHDLVDAAQRSGLGVSLLARAADALERAGLLATDTVVGDERMDGKQ